MLVDMVRVSSCCEDMVSVSLCLSLVIMHVFTEITTTKNVFGVVSSNHAVRDVVSRWITVLTCGLTLNHMFVLR